MGGWQGICMNTHLGPHLCLETGELQETPTANMVPHSVITYMSLYASIHSEMERLDGMNQGEMGVWYELCL